MIFRQFIEPLSSTYTYLLACEETGRAVLIDPVLPAWERDVAEINRLGLTLAYTLDSHIHADHITAAHRLKRETGSHIAHPRRDNLTCVDQPVDEDLPLTVGSVTLQPIHTPGHTDNHFAYVVGGRVFTGDALLIDGCGRTDFQNGDAATLYASVHQKLFVLPEETLVYPAHDYHDRRVSSIGQEKQRNPRLGEGKTREDFIKIMRELKLAYPKFMDYAVPGNRNCGLCLGEIPKELKEYCHAPTDSPQG